MGLMDKIVSASHHGTVLIVVVIVVSLFGIDTPIRVCSRFLSWTDGSAGQDEHDHIEEEWDYCLHS
jgi:hypothetical protein